MKSSVASLIAGAALVLGSCSFTTATGFNECNTHSQCGKSQVCVEHFCLPLPANCRRDEGSFAPESISVAALLPMKSGPGADDAELAGLNALELAVREVNKKGLGRPFGLYACDTYGTSIAAEEQTRFMVTQLHVPALITSGSAQTEAVANVAERKSQGTLVISATATSPDLIGIYQIDRAVWRVAPPDTQQANVMAALLTQPNLVPGTSYRTDGGTTVLYQDDSYGGALANALAAKFPMTLKPYLKPFTPGTSGTALVAALGTSVNGGAPVQTVFIGQPPDLNSLVTAIVGTSGSLLKRTAGHQWLFSDLVRDPSIVSATTAPELTGALGTSPSSTAGTEYSQFRLLYRGNFNSEPTDYPFISNGYDAMYLVMLAATWADTQEDSVTGPAMNRGMTKLSLATGPKLSISDWTQAYQRLSTGNAINAEGASGDLDFDYDAGAVNSAYEVWRVTDGGITVAGTLAP